MVVSFAALFVALGGVGYAATQLPPNSVGSAQLKNGSVGNWKLKWGSVGARKIMNGSVGAKQVNANQVQLRVAESCATGAISAISLSGSVRCTPALPPNELGTTAVATIAQTGGHTTVATESLSAGSSYLVIAFPHAVISGEPPTTIRVEVTCTLSVPAQGSAAASSIAKTLAVDLGTDGNALAGTIPLILPVAAASPARAATMACYYTASPYSSASTVQVSVDTTLNALQTASNG